jgi:FKBP-type peptidyl-prolyl cis-trans isomerase SlyD
MLIAIPQYKGTVSGAYELSLEISLHRVQFASGTHEDEGIFPFPGVQAAVAWLQEKDVRAVLVGTMDPDNADVLADLGINVFTGADDMTPAENVGRFVALMRDAIARQHAHQNGGGCCGGGGCGEHGEAEGSEEGHECCGGGGEDCCGGAGHDDPNHECRCAE